MKKFFLMFVCMIFAFACGKNSAQFEGTIETNEELGGIVRQSKITFLGSDIRVENINAKSDYTTITIIKSDEEKIISLVPKNKEYVKFDFKILKDILKEEAGDNASEKASKTTGKSNTLHSYICNEYVDNDEYWGTSVTAWICENFVNSKSDTWKMLIEFLNREKGTSGWWNVSLQFDNGFPFEATKTRDDKTEYKLEITKVDKNKPDGNLFEIPKDYKDMDMDFETYLYGK